MRLIFILILFVFLISCNKSRKNPDLIFYSDYSHSMHVGINSIDTLKIKIKDFVHEHYYMGHFINDSLSQIYLLKNNKRYYFDTTGSEIITKYKNAECILYYGKRNEIYQSSEKTSIDISAYYKNDTAYFTLSEIFLCAPRPGDFGRKKLSGTLIVKGKSSRTSDFCLFTSDTIKIIEHFKTLEKFNLFRKQLND